MSALIYMSAPFVPYIAAKTNGLDRTGSVWNRPRTVTRNWPEPAGLWVPHG
jgi:hypothetical protein